MRKAKWRRIVVGIYVEMIFCCAKLTAQTNTFPSSGNVGIGTTTPNAALAIDGNGVGAFGQLAIGPGDASAGNYQLLLGAETGFAGIQTIQQGVGYNQGLALQPFGGRVGIGIVNPLATLHVVYNIANPYDLLSWEQGIPADTGTSYFSHRLTSTNGTYGPYGFGGEIAGFLTQGAGGGLTLSTVNGSAPVEVMRLNYNGNVGIGTIAPGAMLDVAGSVRISGTGASLTFPDGTVQSTAYVGTTCPTGGDYAESIDVTGDRHEYEPGDVMVIDPSNPGHFLKSSEPYSTLVAGIYSTKPGFVGRRQTTDPKTSISEIPMAMVGIVPTKVSAENGPIKVGDLLVTSSTLGYVMKGTDRNAMTGAIVGKALGKLESGIGVVEVLVSLQ